MGILNDPNLVMMDGTAFGSPAKEEEIPSQSPTNSADNTGTFNSSNAITNLMTPTSTCSTVLKSTSLSPTMPAKSPQAHGKKSVISDLL